MPLKHSPSKAAFRSNVRAEIASGKPQNQALAIAYKIKRERKNGGRAFDSGGAIDPLSGFPLEPSPRAQKIFNTIADHYAYGIRDFLQEFGKQAGTIPSDRTPEEMEYARRAAAPGVAFGMLGVGAPNAMTGAAGIFGGRLAQTANHAALARAEQMAAKGASKDDIWNQTGWFQGADNKWRFEIPDNPSQMNPNTYVKGKPLPEFGTPSKIAGELWHPPLYEAYPDMRNVLMRVERGDNRGRYFPDPGVEGSAPVIQVNASNPATARSVALHEIQHDIQAREGFAKGSNLAGGRDAYQRSAGEVEAANVQRRLFLTPEQRKTVPPWATENYPRDQQIVNMKYPSIIEKSGGGEVMSDPALGIAYRIKREGRAIGGPPPAGWQTRAAARGMTHSGPIMSAVPGRTDNHAMKVRSSSYVLPADHVSSLGQGNTQAGMAVLNQMFGSSGPYGMGRNPAIKRGSGAPRAPRTKSFADGGTAEDVDVMTAGGEYVIPPETVAEIGGGDPGRGHAILDNWVIQNRKNHVKVLRKLPPPAKD